MIRLLVADDHPVVREGLRRIVTDHPGLVVAAEAVDGDQVLSALRRVVVDVVLLDISMPGPGFLQVLEWVRAEHPRLPVLALSVHPEDQYAVRALRAGAAGYLTKDHSPEQLVEAIRKVHRGGRFVSPSLAERLATDLAPGRTSAPHERLSDREYQVLCLLGSGRMVKEISVELRLSPKTVSTYRTRLLEKMQVAGNADLVRYAAQHGLIR